MYAAKLSSALRGFRAGIAPLIAFAMLLPGTASAHGVVGDRLFLSPIVGNDAFPDNALTLSARRSNYEFSLLPSLEKQLSDYSSLLIIGGWNDVESKPGAKGMSDLTIYFRQSALISVPHELELTVSPLLVVPTGNRRVADEGYTHLGVEALLAKGMGDLPDARPFKYLRPFALQAEAGYAGRVQGPVNSDDFANLEIEYSLEYLDRFVERDIVPYALLSTVPYLEFDYSQSFIASRLTTSPDFRLTPGLAYMGQTFELSVGSQIALNGACANGDRVAVLGLVEIFYDDIYPALSWKPF
jgi:hypothetical protein